MAKLDILQYPDPRLRTRAERVAHVEDDVKRLIDDMLETMYEAPGIGLAATQVDVHRQVIVIDLSEDGSEPRVFINPEILERDGDDSAEEGCLSIPGVYDSVGRAERVRVSALDREGKPFGLEADGLLARCIQHEVDHLEGRLFIDYLSELKRKRLRRRFEKAARQRSGAASGAV